MCGISFYYSNKFVFSERLVSSLEVTKHRGPDSCGTFEVKHDDVYVGLGHNRLSVIELSDAGKQPMHKQDEISIIFNGEIYNHELLRNGLQSKGYSFIGNSDTEVILNLYAEYGVESFSMLKGMFAIVILDRKTGQINIVRDAIGIKPIYITKNDEGIFGCSEIKGLKALVCSEFEVDTDDIYEFFNNGFLYEPATGFQGVKKIMPGELLTIELATGECSYRKLIPILGYMNDSSFESKLKSSIEDQLIADVPLGIFFSGGADSSILASYARDSDLFFAEYASDSSADVDKRYSKLIAEYLNRKIVTHKFDDSDISAEKLIEQVRFVAINTEELISDYTFWSTYQLSQAARDNGYKVMLSGMGGDEAFAGYPRYHVLQKHRLFELFGPILKLMLKFGVFPKALDKKFARLVSYISEKNWPVAYSRLLGYFSRNELTKLFGKSEGELYSNYSKRLKAIFEEFDGDRNDKVKAGQFLDRLGFLSHNLMVSDKASMLASIELRVPLLDEAIVSQGMLEKSSNLIDSKNTKKPLKDILLNCIPNRLVERPKTGFNPPLDALINKLGKDRLSSELGEINRFVSSDFSIKLVEEHFSGIENNAYKIWQLLYFKFWLENQSNP
ncbi:asparagine synthase (glutamine-hydrolyzing) [Vibrio fluvialis]|uniref:asparagine synthase (glutamine-hydrolyzing) n=2 Tax=Vibrio fluvialis TaxID=676 RepID=UPI001F27BEB4|nr:asparagine synthase (glutamine-hydrolyzing) [Vibrio fluvialis]MCE7661684.1 asparagine synthase (glutamine-hydrolyzing) [Vibrio fluvialis]UPO64617.1 glutamine amidotransferase domain/asparagine synthase [Vibrio fluvialis]